MHQCLRRHIVWTGTYRRLLQVARRLSDKVPYTPRYASISQDTKLDDREYIPAGGKGRSALDILKDDLKPAFRGEIKSLEMPVPRHTDILIIGGGLIGTSITYFLKAQSAELYDVTVVERDFAYTRASSMLSTGGIRHQFSLPENVQMSMFTTEFIKHYKEHLSVYEVRTEVKNGMFKWLRESFIAFVEVTFGRSLNRQLRETVYWIFSESMLMYYIKNFKDSMWPNGKLAEPLPTRTKEEKLRTRLKAKEKFLLMQPDAVKTLVGEENARRGTVSSK